jgi:flagellar hook assembly protein FlgD
VSLRIFDPAGRLVRTLVNTPVRAGIHDVFWDGRSDAGVPVAGGVYFYQLKVDGETLTRRVILVR